MLDTRAVFWIRIRLIQIRIQPIISIQIRIPDPDLVKFIEIIIFILLQEENHFSSLFLSIYNETMLNNNTVSKKFPFYQQQIFFLCDNFLTVRERENCQE